MTIVGLISDTHGLLRPQALDALEGSDLIVHAGDIGSPEVIETLRGLAPVYAVRGNNDRAPWAESIPDTLTVPVGRLRLFVIHRVQDLALGPAIRDYAAVISGHSHRPMAESRNGVLFVNPGSAGPRRFSLPITVARLHVRGDGVTADIVPLDV